MAAKSHMGKYDNDTEELRAQAISGLEGIRADLPDSDEELTQAEFDKIRSRCKNVV